MHEEEPVRFAINVVTRDQVGVVADVSDALFALGANLEAMSQTVVWGWFTMIVCAAFPRAVTAAAVKEAVEASGDFHATVLPSADLARPQAGEGEPFVVSVIGGDRPGIVRALTRCFAERGINIDDIWNEVREGRFIVIFHVTLPRHVDAKEIRYRLEQVGQEVGVAVTLQHQDIFTATNSLSMRSRRTSPEAGRGRIRS